MGMDCAAVWLELKWGLTVAHVVIVYICSQVRCTVQQPIYL